MLVKLKVIKSRSIESKSESVEIWIQKIQIVFKCFQKHDNSCSKLWQTESLTYQRGEV